MYPPVLTTHQLTRVLHYWVLHRYHVDSLLAMYDLYRHLGENQYAEVGTTAGAASDIRAWLPEHSTYICAFCMSLQESLARGKFWHPSRLLPRISAPKHLHVL
jgi:hypothetical protein